jgi:death-on-curing family protein
MNPEFLEVDDVIRIHANQIAEHGGSEGLRDLGLLVSAVAQPSATLDGEFLNRDLFLMAPSLLISLVKNHPFVDGNKRTALLSTLVFVDLNGHPIEHASPDLDSHHTGHRRGAPGESGHCVGATVVGQITSHRSFPTRLLG